MESTIAGLTSGASNWLRLVLRSLTLGLLVMFLIAAVMGLFESPAHTATDDGAVKIDYQGAIRSGNALKIAVSIAPDECDALTLSLDAAYADLIDEMTVEPAPTAEATAADGTRIWTFDTAPQWVQISGRAADGWSRPVAGAVHVECGESYRLELHTTRIP